jgi:hypothetical protein
MLMDFYDKAFNMSFLYVFGTCAMAKKLLSSKKQMVIDISCHFNWTCVQMRMRLCRPEAILTFPVSLSLQFFLKVMRLTLMPTNQELINKN